MRVRASARVLLRPVLEWAAPLQRGPDATPIRLQSSYQRPNIIFKIIYYLLGYLIWTAKSTRKRAAELSARETVPTIPGLENRETWGTRLISQSFG